MKLSKNSRGLNVKRKFLLGILLILVLLTLFFSAFVFTDGFRHWGSEESKFFRYLPGDWVGMLESQDSSTIVELRLYDGGGYRQLVFKRFSVEWILMSESSGGSKNQFSEHEGGSIEIYIFEKGSQKIRVDCDSDSLKIYNHPEFINDIEFQRKDFELGKWNESK